MEAKKSLYPIKFRPSSSEAAWGEIKVGISDTGINDPEASQGWLEGNTVGEILETYLEKIVGEDLYQYYGRMFPLSVKFLTIHGKYPVMVHPDDEIAEQRYDALGGARMWYVLQAGQNAKIYIGFNEGGEDARDLYDRCFDGTETQVLNEIHPKAGDAFLISPGTVYSADGELQIVEILESSPIDLAICDRSGRHDPDIEFNLAEALDFIDFAGADNSRIICGHSHHEHCGCEEHHHHEDEVVRKLVQSREFSVNELKVSDPLHIYSEKFGRFIIYVCLEGKVSVQVPSKDDKGNPKTDNYYIEAGEIILIPADMPDFFLVPVDRNSRLLEAMIEKHEDDDEYIDPSTEAYLDDEDYEGLDEEEDECDDHDCHCNHDECNCKHKH